MSDQQQPTADSRSEQLHLQVHAEIGRLLLLYQHLELMLKALLPHLEASEEIVLDQADKDIDDLFDSKQTMGLLVDMLKRSLEMPDPDGFSNYLAQITANRNELVHKFTLLNFGGLDTEAKCKSAIDHLKTQHDFALPLRGVLLAFLRTLMNPPNASGQGG